MPRLNLLLRAPPHAVETALASLGANLRVARLRRNLSLQEMGDKIGASRQVVADAEIGKPSTSAAVYVALLWALGLLDQLGDVADPARDEEGTTLAASSERRRGGRRAEPDNDF